MFRYLDLESLESRTDDAKRAFETASPFKHIAFKGLVRDERLAELEEAFPPEEWPSWDDTDHGHQRYKMSCGDISKLPSPLANLVHELNSGPFLSWLERVTGIDQLLPDPHLIGGGLHLTKPGGWLTPHTDFHTVRRLSLYRRLNLLLYLNSDWRPEYNGYLELWEKHGTKPEREVKPELGQSVLFQTDDVSVHGFSRPLVDRSRFSVALYYYSAADASEYSGSGLTFWRPHAGQARGIGDHARYATERVLMAFSRAFASVSWRIATMARKTWR